MINLKEKNKKVIERQVTDNEEMRAYRTTFKHFHKFDPLDAEKLPVLKEGFSWGKVAQKMGYASLREAEQSTAWVQLLRAGVQQIVNNAYQMVETTYDDFVTVVPSSKDTELYAPIQGVNFPREVAQGGLFPEVNMAGLNIKLENKKYGSMFAYTQELSEDDQTAQVNKQATLLGEYLRIVTEVLCYGKLISPSGGVNYIDLFVPVSETKPSNENVYPWTPATTPFVGGGFNRPASYGAFNLANIIAGYQALMQQKNLLGLIMQVNPNRALVSPLNAFDAATLLNSSYYPAGAQSAGTTGGAFAVNPIKGLVNLTVSRYMPNNSGTITANSKAWALVDDSKPWFVLQLREATNLIMEAPNSGQSFDRQLIRFRASARMNADFIDPRFAWLGNDGSV